MPVIKIIGFLRVLPLDGAAGGDRSLSLPGV